MSRKRKRKTKSLFVDFETRSLIDDVLHPDQNFTLTGRSLRVPGENTVPQYIGDSHFAEGINALTEKMQRYCTWDTDRVIMGGDLVHGPHTNTVATEPDYVATERRLMAWWADQYERVLRATLYGAVNPFDNNYRGLLDNPYGPAKSGEKDSK